MKRDKARTRTIGDEPVGFELPYARQRREDYKEKWRTEPWLVVLNVLLVVLIAGDFSNIFLVIERALRTNYVVITLITVSLTMLSLLLPYLVGRFARERSRGSTSANYLLVVVLTFAWFAMLVAITLLRLAADGLPPFTVPAGTSIGAAPMQSGNAIAALNSSSRTQSVGTNSTMVIVLSVLLSASGLCAALVSYAGSDPLRKSAKRAHKELIRLQESTEELAALGVEFALAETHYQNLIDREHTRYAAAQDTVILQSRRLAHKVRTDLALHLGDPSATSALLDDGFEDKQQASINRNYGIEERSHHESETHMYENERNRDAESFDGSNLRPLRPVAQRMRAV